MNSALAITTINSLPRYEYGAFGLHLIFSGELRTQVSAFVSDAVKAGLLQAPFTTALGQLAHHYLGKTTVARKKAHVPVSTAYKVLAKTTDGRLVSTFDDSEYKIGVWRSEAAKPGHGGGFCYYRD